MDSERASLQSLLLRTDNLFLNINASRTTLAAFVDLRKAFDTVRLEAKSEKGPRNHFRGNRVLEDVTHVSSPD